MLRAARARGRPRRGRARGARACSTPAPPRGLHGLPDAQHRRLRGDRADPRRRAGGRRVPIIAMTAHAFAGDRERCLRAGHGRLPLEAAALRRPRRGARALGRASRRPTARRGRAARSTRRACAASTSTTAAWPRSSWTCSPQATPPLIDELREAVERGDAEECRRLAHKLKGSSETVGATRMATLSRALEQGGPDGLAVVEELETAYDRTRDELLRLAALA